ncbi:uncharacterized protein LOC132557726, partial [Ylistrum balloti]|uniref:uncharacterized protein LOC132557726 n=1 Tax=Ylistrum balloti TaxID=509963 RepID=UPI002905AA8D
YADVFAEPETEDVSLECGPTPCFEPVSSLPELVLSLDLCENGQSCSLSSFAVTEDNNILGMDQYENRVVLYSGQDGSILNTYNFEFELEELAYQDHGTFFIGHTPRNDRTIYKYNASSGQLTEILSIRNGMSSYGMEFLDGMLFVGGQYGGGMHVYLLGQPNARVVEIYSHITNYDQYHSVYLCTTELGSKYGLFTGRMVRNEMVLITSTGERICSIKPDYEYQSIRCGVVSREGTFYLPGERMIVRYNTRCEPTGMFPILDVDYYVSGLDIQNGKLYVHKQNGRFDVFQI